MENSIKGNVETISKQNNAVQINGVWYNLAEHVKMQYVKKGECEYRSEATEDGVNDLIVFIKSTARPTNNPTSSSSSPKMPAIAESEMNRMSALKFAGNVYLGTGQEPDAKRLAEEAHEYLQKGIWVTHEKP